MKNNYITQAWLVLFLAVCFGGGLAGMNTILGPRIKENKRTETSSQVPSLVPGADASKTQKFVCGAKVAHKAINSDDKHLGWVIKASGSGFADKIELLIGLDPQATKILGLYVLDQKETPALGDKIRGDWFLSQFATDATGKNLDAADELTVVKSPKVASTDKNQIQAISGATVSSVSVCNIINKAVADFRTQLTNLQPAEKE